VLSSICTDPREGTVATAIRTFQNLVVLAQPRSATKCCVESASCAVLAAAPFWRANGRLQMGLSREEQSLAHRRRKGPDEVGWPISSGPRKALGSLFGIKRRSYSFHQLRCSVGLLDEALQTFASEKPDGFQFVVATGKNHANIRANQLELPQRLFATHYRHVQIKNHETDAIYRGLVFSSKLLSFCETQFFFCQAEVHLRF